MKKIQIIQKLQQKMKPQKKLKRVFHDFSENEDNMAHACRMQAAWDNFIYFNPFVNTKEARSVDKERLQMLG